MGWSCRGLKRRKHPPFRGQGTKVMICNHPGDSQRKLSSKSGNSVVNSWCNCTVWWGQYSTFINNAILNISHKHDSMITMHSTSPWEGHLPMAPWLRPWGRWGCQWKPNSWKASNSLARKLSERFKYLPNKGVQQTKIWWYNHILKSCSPRGSYIERESIHSGILQKPRCQPAWNPTSIELHLVMSSPAGGTLLVAKVSISQCSLLFSTPSCYPWIDNQPHFKIPFKF